MRTMSENPFIEDAEEYIPTWEAADILGYKNSSSVRNCFYSGRLDGVRWKRNSRGRWLFHKQDLLKKVKELNPSGSTAADAAPLVRKRAKVRKRVPGGGSK